MVVCVCVSVSYLVFLVSLYILHLEFYTLQKRNFTLILSLITKLVDMIQATKDKGSMGKGITVYM